MQAVGAAADQGAAPMRSELGVSKAPRFCHSDYHVPTSSEATSAQPAMLAMPSGFDEEVHPKTQALNESLGRSE